MSQVRRIVMVGHCASDAWAIKIAVERAAPGVAIESVSSFEVLGKLDLSGCLLLINRVLPAGYPVSMGVDLIRRLGRDEHPPRMLLVSNLPDAQRQAEQAGALPGFGKDDLLSEKARDRIRAATGLPTAASSR